MTAFFVSHAGFFASIIVFSVFAVTCYARTIINARKAGRLAQEMNDIQAREKASAEANRTRADVAALGDGAVIDELHKAYDRADGVHMGPGYYDEPRR